VRKVSETRQPSNGWPNVRVADLLARKVLAINDGYRVTNRELGPAGIPFVRGGNIGYRGEIDTSVKDHIRIEFADRVTEKLARPGDVAFITKGTVGRVGVLRSGQPEVVFAPQVCYWRSLDPEVIEPRFLLYLLSSRQFQGNLEAVKTHGSMVADYVSLSDQQSFVLPLPPIADQRAITRILGVLDDKIELNQRMRETLEAIVNAIFRSWFVDFDPVRARAEGRPPHGMDAHTEALFPSEFEHGEFGQTPKGWRVVSLNEAATFVKGVSYKSAELVDGSAVALVTLKSFRRDGGYREDGLKPYIGRFKPEQVIAAGEVVVSHTDVTQAAEVLGRAVRVPRHPTHRTLVASLDAVIVRPRGQLSNELLVGLLTRESFRDHARAYANGTTVLHLSPRALPAYRFLLPPPQLIGAYSRAVQPILGLIETRNGESRTLLRLRDTLLPKLLSGEIRATDAQKLVERETP